MTKLGAHFLDTGPLLCLGHSRTGGFECVIADYYDMEFLGGARVTEAVAGELMRHSSEPLRAGAAKMKGTRKKAAKSAAYHYAVLMADSISRPEGGGGKLADIERTLREKAELKNPGKSFHEDEHKGEAESVFWAAELGASLVACDNDARTVASEFGIRQLTFVELSRQLMRKRKEISALELFTALQGTAASQIDIGEPLNSYLDLS